MPTYDHSIADACLYIIRGGATEGRQLTAEDIACGFITLQAMAKANGGKLLGRAAALYRLARDKPALAADTVRRALARDPRVVRCTITNNPAFDRPVVVVWRPADDAAEAWPTDLAKRKRKLLKPVAPQRVAL